MCREGGSWCEAWLGFTLLFVQWNQSLFYSFLHCCVLYVMDHNQPVALGQCAEMGLPHLTLASESKAAKRWTLWPECLSLSHLLTCSGRALLLLLHSQYSTPLLARLITKCVVVFPHIQQCVTESANPAGTC